MPAITPLVSLNAALAWPVPVQILSLPHKAYDAPTLETQALHLLNKYHFQRASQDVGLKQSSKPSTHIFGNLEGLRYAAKPESSDLDEKLIAPYLLREGCEGK